MFRAARRLWGLLRGARPVPSGDTSRNDTEHLRSSKVNEARLNAAIAELDAGRGALASMSELRGRLGDVAAR